MQIEEKLKSLKTNPGKQKVKVLEADLISTVKKHYGNFRLEWVRQNPVWKKAIPDYLVCQKRDRSPKGTTKAGFIEFKCETNFLEKYTVAEGTRPKIRADGREQQLMFVKNLLSNSCIVNYNKDVQLVEEYKWVIHNSNIGDVPPSRLVLISCCTLKDIKILSIEDMLV